MAEDWANTVRAVRFTEILGQYRDYLQQVATYQIAVPLGQAQARGYVLLEQYHQDAQAMATLPLDVAAPPAANDNEARRQLQRIMLDATARRFKAYKLLNSAEAVMTWVGRRVHLLEGQEPGQQHIAALAQIDADLEQELAEITDQKAYDELRDRDEANGLWMAEMVDLQTLLSYIQGELTE